VKFLDLLHSGADFDCDLIIGNSDMPASFVWNSDDRLTEYGIEKFRPILEADYKILPNGNIEVLCDDWNLGEIFCLTVAGYISEAEYNRIFVVI
jgi:hypothetical protein